MPSNDVVEAIDQYCSRLWKALHKVPSPDRDEIVREVRSHIVEHVQAEPKVTEEVLIEILRAVGDPKELASEYRTQTILRQATRTRLPWVLVRATLRWGATSVAGLVAFLATVVGYGCAAVFLLGALLKPVFPSRIGLWLTPQHMLSFGYWNGRLSGAELYGISVRPPASFVLGTLGPTDGPLRELLGVWFIPVGILCGAFSLLGTSVLARWLIRKFSRSKKWSPSLAYVQPIIGGSTGQ